MENDPKDNINNLENINENVAVEDIPNNEEVSSTDTPSEVENPSHNAQNANNFRKSPDFSLNGREAYRRTLNNKNIYDNTDLNDRLNKQKLDLANKKNEIENAKKKVKGEDGQEKEVDKTKDDIKKEKKESKQAKKDILETKGKMLENKVNNIKSKAFQATHPLEAAKMRAKDYLKKKLKKVLLSKGVIIGFLVLMSFIIIMVIIGGSSFYFEAEPYAPKQYDYNLVKVQLKSALVTEESSGSSEKGVSTGTVVITYTREDTEKTTLRNLVYGTAYFYLHDKITTADIEDEDVVYEAYQLLYILARSDYLSKGKYNTSLIDQDTGMTFINTANPETVDTSHASYPTSSFCNITYGCQIIKHTADENSPTTMKSLSQTTNLAGGANAGTTIDITLNAELQIMQQNAFNISKYLLLIPEEYDDVLTEYNYDINIDYSKVDEWLNKIREGYGFQDVIEEYYPELYLYNLGDYVDLEYLGSSASYWWPIGENSSGTISCLSIGYPYGYSAKYFDNSVFHDGVDISCVSVGDPVIAVASGEIISSNSSCPTYGQVKNVNGNLIYSGEGGSVCTNGNFVNLKTDNGDIIIYGHLMKDSVTVSSGSRVKQGDVIGKVGSSGMSTGAHLHFGIKAGGVTSTDPEEYISGENPRP